MDDAADPVAILLVDDRPEKLAVLGAALEAPDLRLITAGSGAEALRLLLHTDVAVILLDVDMPGMDGYETARLIRGRERSRHTPIIFITAYASDETPVAKGYALGAVDYLFAPVGTEVLRAKVAAFVELHRLRAQAQQRAESSENRWAALAEAVPQLVWSTDAAGRMNFVNRRWLEYTGIPYERSQALGWSDVIHPDDLPAMNAAWERAVADAAAFEMEFRLRRGGDGAWRWFLCRGVPRYDRAGRLEGWTGTSTDVHEVRETGRRLRWLLDNTSETVWRFDLDGPVQVGWPEDEQLDAFYRHGYLGESNAAMARAYGFASVEEMQGLRLGRLVPREDPANEAMLRAFIRGGYRLIDAESSERAKDGSERFLLNNLIGEIEGGLMVRAWGTSRDITERKRRERELAESERRFRAVANVVPVLIWESGTDGRRTWFNTRWLDFTGRAMEQELGDGWIEGVHPDDRARFLADYRAAFAVRRSFAWEYRLRRADGRWRWISANGAPRFAPDGTFLGYVACCFDIHDQREAEAALAARERQLTLITDAVPALIAYVDVDERFRFVNQTHQRYFGAAAAAIVGRRLAELMPATTYERITPHMRLALAGDRESFDAELDYRGVGRRWMHVEYVPDRSADGVIHGVVVLVNDITDRRRGEDRARLLADATAALSGPLDPDRALTELATLVVPRLADWCTVDLATEDDGLRRVALRHRDPARIAEVEEYQRLYPPREEDAVTTVLRTREPIFAEVEDAALTGYARDQDQLRLLRAFGLRSVIVVPLEARGRALGVLTLVAAESGRVFDQGDLAFARDLAARAGIAVDNVRLYREAERQRGLAGQRADQLAASNAELEQFAYVSSHDLQEPLRMVTQYMGLLQHRYADRLDARGRSFVAYAAEGAARMHRLIDDLLVYAQAPGRADQPFAVVELGPLVAEVLANLRAQIEDSGARIELGELPAVRGDRTRLALVFQNLIGNALKFSSRPASVRIAGEQIGPVVELAISDHGIGIEPQHQARIFEVFQRLHSRERYPGTGIGLAICKKIVEQHGGRIWVESRPGVGSTFRFTVPAAGTASSTGLHPARR